MNQPIQQRFFPETAVGGFSRVDGSIEFWSRVAALIEPDFRVLDYGAGRGAYIDNDSSPYRQRLKTLKGRVAELVGCDVDPVVMDNPYLDRADVIDFGKPLPYADGEFDLVVANWVLEHVQNPALTARELARVTKPGGWIAAATANRFGYVALASSLVPNKSHAKALDVIKPGAVMEHDVFPTAYKMNTRGKLKELFGSYGEVYAYTNSAEPSYHFNNGLIYRLQMVLHDLFPQALQTGLYLFVHRR